MHEDATKQQCPDDLPTLMKRVWKSWGHNAPFETKRYKEACSQYSTDYVFCSANYATTAGFLTMENVEDFFLQLEGEQRRFDKRFLPSEYINGNIPLKFYWSDSVPQIIKPNEFLMVPVESAGSILEEKFIRFDTEQQNHANIPPADYFRKSETVPHCKGFSKWMKQWKNETAEEQEYRILAISRLYVYHIRKNTQQLKGGANGKTSAGS